MPNCPTRCCRKKTGPFELSLIATAIARSSGERSTSPQTLPKMSRTRFVAEYSLLLGIAALQVGIKLWMTRSLGYIVIPVFWKNVVGNRDLIEVIERQRVVENSADPESIVPAMDLRDSRGSSVKMIPMTVWLVCQPVMSVSRSEADNALRNLCSARPFPFCSPACSRPRSSNISKNAFFERSARFLSIEIIS